MSLTTVISIIKMIMVIKITETMMVFGYRLKGYFTFSNGFIIGLIVNCEQVVQPCSTSKCLFV